MNNIPPIEKFLDLIDPDKQIDRKQALIDITTITILLAYKKASILIPPEDQHRVNTILGEPTEDFIKKVYDIFELHTKLDDLLKITEQIADEVKKDYIKTQLKALTEDKRNALFSESLTLKTLFEEQF